MHAEKINRKCLCNALYLRIPLVSHSQTVAKNPLLIRSYFYSRCSLWLKYGLLTNEASVVLVNIAGTCLMFCYTIIFYVLSTNKKVILRQFATVLLVLVSVVAYTQYETELSKSIEILGEFP